MKPITERDYYTVAEVAEILEVSHSTVWRWIRAGKLRAYRVGARNLRVRQRDLEAARARIGEIEGESESLKETRETPYDVFADTSSREIDEDVAWKGLTPEERKERLFRPLTDEERQEQMALFERVMERRKGRSIAPMTSDELVRRSREREFWYGPDS